LAAGWAPLGCLVGRIARSGKELIDSLIIQPDMHVLDLGCGDGTTARPAAQRGANVLGVDIATNLVSAGNARAAAAGLNNLRFQEGDACDLQGLLDGSSDLVISAFGAMFAPRPFDMAREMGRVTRSGGRIVIGSLIPGDPTLIVRFSRPARPTLRLHLKGLSAL
jgi:ubiquinone/menaquinone biosynthesis C-methylase UbiE